MKYALDLYKETGVVDLSIHEDCKKNIDFSDALEIGQSCHDCEFCMDYEVPSSSVGGFIGGNVGHASFCEKGYWKEEI